MALIPPGRRRRRLPPGVLIWTLLACAPALAAAQNPPPDATQSPEAPPAPQATDPAQPAPADPAETPRFLESVTISATLTPAAVKDTPGTVSVIGAETIERHLMQNLADLVKFEPGIYVETVANRVGLNGINIRGVGGNRVMTQIDGVETSEQFDFGPFNVHQFALDLDTLKSAEIVRSAGSSLYGSDALGGVVSFFTKDPVDYLSGRRSFNVGAKTVYDSRSNESSTSAVVAGGRQRVQASLFAGYATGHEAANQGTIESTDATRTALNPQDRETLQLLGKMVVTIADGNTLRAAVETADNEVRTEGFSLRTATVRDIDSDDTMRRRRVSVDQSIASRGWVNLWSWSLYGQTSDTRQVVDETQVTAINVRRHGTLDFDQDSFGGTVQGRKAFTSAERSTMLIFGGSYRRNVFDMLRDRVDVNTATGAVIPVTNLILPSKYFPKSTVGETGAYAQAETRLSRLTLLTGLRFDRFTLDSDEADAVYIATLSPTAADFDAGRASARLGAAWTVTPALTLHGQYAGGFRAPPYSAINSGFTNLAGGYTSIPNTELRPETSNNFEFGVRATTRRFEAAATGFSNYYDDFIIQAQRGLNPVTRLLEFQYQNLTKARIRGVELQGDVRLASTLRLRAAYAVIRGDDVSGETDVPLNTIAPDQGVVGLQYVASSRWGSDVSLRTARGQSPERAGEGLFAPDAYAVLDLTGWVSLGGRVVLRGGLFNLTDQKYFEWPNVRGRQATDPVIDRYSSPGVNGMVAVSYGW